MNVGSSMKWPMSESRTELLLWGAAANSADWVSTVSNLLDNSSCVIWYDSDFSESRFIRSMSASTPTSCSPTMLGEDGGDGMFSARIRINIPIVNVLILISDWTIRWKCLENGSHLSCFKLRKRERENVRRDKN